MTLFGSGADPTHPDSVAVYELLNEADALLYVGITHNPKARFAQHAESKRWWWEVATWNIEWHVDREAALKVEAAVIYGRYPAYNLIGTFRELPPQDWFVEHWTKVFGSQRPGFIDLNVHHREMVKAKSLRPDARMMWPAADHLEVYEFMLTRATARVLREHNMLVAKREIERWRKSQARDERRRLEDMEADRAQAEAEAEAAGPLLTGLPRLARRRSTKKGPQGRREKTIVAQLRPIQRGVHDSSTAGVGLPSPRRLRSALGAPGDDR